MAEVVKILGIAESLGKGSYNRYALRAAVKLVPPGSTLEIVDLDGIPPFNEDHEKEFPPAARGFKTKVSAPYGPVQRSVSRTLKKALDPNGILASGKSGIR